MHYFWVAMRYYATFKGRTSQRGYWYYQLIISIVSLIWICVPLFYYTNWIVNHVQLITHSIQQSPDALASLNLNIDDQITQPWYLHLISKLGSLFALITFIPSLAINVRRLHDTGRSGSYFWLIFLPIIGWIILLVWLCQQGQPLDNAYGSDPSDTRSGTTMPE